MMEKAREEIDSKLKHKNIIEELDMANLTYLTCIVNEALRLYPPGPLLVPHTSAECTVGGAERFEGRVEGYKFMPFGVGRRGFPGVGMAVRVAGLGLGALIQGFEWERVGEELVDMSEGSGTTMPKHSLLEAMYRPRSMLIIIDDPFHLDQ
ncbi:hypothetical protein Sjap_022769 [Stephania japonica]|uniref:Cytochrome P450 n=1 Tax=Stephania japonica TaxID=461633 RepID=A0AAP0HTY0_9MAGN